MKDRVENLGVMISNSHAEILSDWQNKVLELESAQGLDVPTLNDHVPVLIRDIADAFVEHGESEPYGKGVPGAISGDDAKTLEAAESAAEHGFQRHAVGFDLAEVIAEYSIFRDVIFDFAARRNIPLTPKVVGSVNSVMDLAISRAVRVYSGLRAAELREARERHLEFIVHDLRSPLNVIALCVNRLVDLMTAKSSDDQIQRVVPMLQRNVSRLVRLVDQLLAASGAAELESSQTVHLREVQIWPIVEQLCLEAFPVISRQGGQIVNQVDSDLMGYVDAPMFTRVVQNLLANAANAAHDGDVTLESVLDPASKRFRLIVSNSKGVISEEQRLRLTKGQESGTESDGRGLSIIREFVLAMQGRLLVSAGEAVGTSITVELPSEPAGVEVGS